MNSSVTIHSKVIGKGSFATVYLGRNDQGLVAVKCIDKKRLNKRLYESICSEIQMMKQINNEHVVNLLGVEESDHVIKLVTEFCCLGDLSVFLKSETTRNTLGGISIFYIHSFLHQLSKALQVMRHMNLIHRDLKPQNILLHKNENADIVLKLGDFGFARILGDEDLAETLCGSPLYMAPEILRYEKYDSKADLWSVGVILYEMICGKTPFKAKNHVALLKKIQLTKTVLFPDEIPDNNNHRRDSRKSQLIIPASNPICIPSKVTANPAVSYRNLNERKFSSEHPISPASVLKNNGISEELRSLTRSLLKKDPLERISFEEFFLNQCVNRGTSFITDHSNLPNLSTNSLENSKGNARSSTRLQSLDLTVAQKNVFSKYSTSDPLSNSSLEFRIEKSVLNGIMRRVNSTLSGLRVSPQFVSQETPFVMDDIETKVSGTTRSSRVSSVDTSKDVGLDEINALSPAFPAIVLSLPFAQPNSFARSQISAVNQNLISNTMNNSLATTPHSTPLGTISESTALSVNSSSGAAKIKDELNEQPMLNYVKKSLGAVVKAVNDSVRSIVGYSIDDEDQDEQSIEETEEGYVVVKD